MMGGPMNYIVGGLGPKWKWLAVCFAVFGALAAVGIGNMVQTNSVAEGMEQLLGLVPQEGEAAAGGGFLTSQFLGVTWLRWLTGQRRMCSYGTHEISRSSG